MHELRHYVLGGRQRMTIHYPNGKTVEGLLLSQAGGTLRVAARGVNDALVFHSVQGAWIAESREQVRIEPEWQRQQVRPDWNRPDCVYSQELAERLVRVLRANQPDLERGWNSCSRRASAERAAAVGA
jgi:hypothetical protein